MQYYSLNKMSDITEKERERERETVPYNYSTFTAALNFMQMRSSTYAQQVELHQ
jgi:hypothetical protein